jgi:hypothetical protein
MAKSVAYTASLCSIFAALASVRGVPFGAICSKHARFIPTMLGCLSLACQLLKPPLEA